MKKFLYTFVIVAAIAILGFGWYFLFYRPAQPAPATTPGTLPGASGQSGQSAQTPTTPGQAASTTQAKFGVVAQNPVMDFYVDSGNNAILVQPDSQIVEISNGNASVLNSSAMPDLLSASFSFDGKKILASFGNPLTPQDSIFEVASKTWQPTAQSLRSAVWSPDSYQITYLADKNGVQALTTFDEANAGTKPTILATLHINDVILNWIGPNKIIISDKGSTLAAGSVWSFDVQNKTFSPVIIDETGLQSIWNYLANTGLVLETTNMFGGKLSLLNTSGQTLNALTFLTLPSKCVFDIQTQNPPQATSAPTTSSSTKSTSKKGSATPPPVVTPVISQEYLYCAVPRDTQRLNTSALPDDYLKGALFTSDDFWRIDLATGDTSAVFIDPNQNLDATDLKIFNKTLFFVNRFDKKLYAISLGQ